VVEEVNAELANQTVVNQQIERTEVSIKQVEEVLANLLIGLLTIARQKVGENLIKKWNCAKSSVWTSLDTRPN
jgi:hypothetical protein